MVGRGRLTASPWGKMDQCADGNGLMDRWTHKCMLEMVSGTHKGLINAWRETHKCMMEMVSWKWSHGLINAWWKWSVEPILRGKKMHDGKILLSCALAIVIFSLLETIVFKPGPTRQVDPGPGWPRGWTSPGLSKDRPVQWLGQTRLTRAT
jgi:hypothetical protein